MSTGYHRLSSPPPETRGGTGPTWWWRGWTRCGGILQSRHSWWPGDPLSTSTLAIVSSFGCPISCGMYAWPAPHDGCQDQTLTAAGVYNKLRRVIDVSSTYLLASEYMSCPNCKRKVISWSWNIIQQLDIAKQRTFPCILTAKKACDPKVVKLLRERGLGNSCSQVQTILTEQHSEEWLSKTIVYLTNCQSLKVASSAGLIQPISFEEPPKMLPVPQFRWLMKVYLQDVLMRLPDVKAEITSTFGRILKMDSTKKIVGKLAGPVRGTAMWATNVGNEVGQVLMSVITSGEGHALTSMAEGMIIIHILTHFPIEKSTRFNITWIQSSRVLAGIFDLLHCICIAANVMYVFVTEWLKDGKTLSVRELMIWKMKVTINMKVVQVSATQRMVTWQKNWASVTKIPSQ